MKGVWLVPLIKICVKDIFVTDPELFFRLYPPQINIYLLCTSWYNILWKIYNIWWQIYIYIDDYGGRIFQIIIIENFKMKNIKKTYSNWYYVIKSYFIKDTIILRKYSGRKQKATGFVYLKFSPYRDAEGSSQLKLCYHGAIINYSPRIGWGGGGVQIGIVSSDSP